MTIASRVGCTPVSGVSRNYLFTLCAPMGYPHEHASTAGRPHRATIVVRSRVRRSDLLAIVSISFATVKRRAPLVLCLINMWNNKGCSVMLLPC